MHLKAVEVVLRYFPTVEALPHIVDAINLYVFKLSPDLSLSEACAFRSKPLLDWIWGISCTASAGRKPEWSLTNYLRSDRHYNRWQFSRSLEVAAARGDLNVLEWIFTHFSDRDVDEKVVEKAAANRHVRVLQYFLAHDTKRNGEERQRHSWRSTKSNDQRTGTADHAECSSGVNELVVNWGGNDMAQAVENGHYDVARWLNEHTSHANKRRKMDVVVKKALSKGEFALAQELQPPGCDYISDYAFVTGQPDAISRELSRGIIPSIQHVRAAVDELAGRGELKLLQQLVNLCFQSSPSKKRWWSDECFALSNACGKGRLAVVQWLLESSEGQRVPRREEYAMEEAAAGGHIEVVKYLCSRGFSDIRGDALIWAIQAGHLRLVEYLLAEFSYESIDGNVAPFFDSVYSHGRPRQDRRCIILNKRFSVDFGKTVDWAASLGFLDMAQWVLKHHVKEYMFTLRAIKGAVHNGHLEMVKWLHANGVEASTTRLMDIAALKGDMKMIQWLHTNTTAGCTTIAMDAAAYHGHFKMVKWLHSNRSEGCTANAIYFAVVEGHLQLASWLLVHYPRHIAMGQGWDVGFSPKLFEKVLFLHVHEPKTFTTELRRKLLRLRGYSSDVVAWVQENYPVP